jgi:hypothetical protein
MREAFPVEANSSNEETLMAREAIDTGRDKRYVRRGKAGRFKESDDMGRSLAADRRKPAKRVVKSGEGDRGDQRKTHKRSKSRKRSGAR